MAFYGSFLAPVVVVLIMNMIAFGLVVRQLFGISAKNLNKTDTASTTSRLRGAVGVIVLLGLTWVFAIFAIDTAKIVFQYLFAIFNTLQGLFIFVFYCMFKKDAQLAWRKKLPCCSNPEDKSSQKTSSRGRW